MTDMDDEAMKAMARRCAAKYWQTGEPSDEAAARSILSGAWDDQAYTQAALAAIIETQELIAAWLEQYPSPMDDLGMAMRIREICAAIRSGQQFRKDV